MPILIGVDEAGYGPNLGPLVVMATVWRVPRGIDHESLYDIARSVITSEPPAPHDPRVWVTDSKRVYRPSTGLRELEGSVCPMLPIPCSGWPCDFPSLWRSLDSRYHRDASRLPWYRGAVLMIPQVLPYETIAVKRNWLRRGLSDARISLVEVAGRIIDTRRFNARLRRESNKSGLLTSVTLQLVRDLICRYTGDDEVDVVCDRHGGRHRYAAALQASIGSVPVMACHEDRYCSRYRVGVREPGVRIRFMVRSESLLATALASMVAKYLREVAMGAFNRYWSDRVPGLRATAGYPLDARRFRQDIAVARQSLRISDAMFWRNR